MGIKKAAKAECHQFGLIIRFFSPILCQFQFLVCCASKKNVVYLWRGVLPTHFFTGL